MPVQFATTLTAPTLDSLSGKTDVLIEYTPQDNNPDGEIRIERSTDHANWTVIASGLRVDSTQYTDDPTEGDKYYYRVIRDTNDATATSSTQSIVQPFIRNSTLSTTTDIANARTLSMSRANTLAVTPELLNTRSTSRNRKSTLSATLDLLNDRVTLLTRTNDIDARSFNINTSFQFKDPIPLDITRDLTWDYSQQRNAFISNWVYFEGVGYGTAALYIGGNISIRDNHKATALLDYDSSGDGKTDDTSEPQSIYTTNEPVSFPSMSGDDGYYRVVLKDLRPNDYIRTVGFGPAHTWS